MRSLYYKQKQYLEAFEIKQEQRAIKQQYGFRAFVGAGQFAHCATSLYQLARGIGGSAERGS